MKKEYKELMRALLERKKELIPIESVYRFEKLAEADPIRGDAMDVAEHNTEQEMNRTMRLRSTREIQLIDGAIEKMHKGIYGVCESCEEQIETKRLKARPFVEYCIECQEDMERTDKETITNSYKFDNFD